MNFHRLRRKIGQWIRLSPLYAWNDYRVYANSLSSFRRIVENLPLPEKGSLLVVSGRGMNVLWPQVWSVLSLAVRVHGYRGLVLTTRRQRHLNRYYRLLGLELVFFDDFSSTIPPKVPPDIAECVHTASTFEDFRKLYFRNVPVGQIALSTYSRYHGTGVMNFHDSCVLNSVKEWVARICQAIQLAEIVYEQYRVAYLFFTEVFMEEYGAFYYTALNKELNITRFAGTVRDDAFIVQHLTKENDRIHHASLAPSCWQKIKQMPLTCEMEEELGQNFRDRYGDKWHRSKRNHPNTRMMPPEEARRILGIAPGRKVAVIYSHILYDTLFFFGTDLFGDYAGWLVETARVACENAKVDWLVKIHPSNLWRGEFDSLLKGRYEEERLLQNAFSDLPPHVRLISPDTEINPYTWFQMADYGITVRGTAGLEMAALGKSVITAGTGRYEGNGFTIDPKDKDDYLELLRRLPAIPSPSPDQVALAKRYAHAIFVRKPFTVQCLKPRLKTGRKAVRASDDLIYCPVRFDGQNLPPDLQRLSEWIVDEENADLLS